MFLIEYDCTEVGRAFLIHFTKKKFQKVLTRIKIARELKFYVRMIISGSKSVKKGQKMLKKATNWTYTWFFVGFANLKHIDKNKEHLLSFYRTIIQLFLKFFCPF